MENYEKDQASGSANKYHSKISPSFLILGIVATFFIGVLAGFSFYRTKEASNQMSNPQPTIALSKNFSQTLKDQEATSKYPPETISPPPAILPTVEVVEWKTGVIPKCGISFKYPGNWMYHVNTLPSDRGVTFQFTDTFLSQGKELNVYIIAGGMGCDAQDFYNDYKSIESASRSYGSDRVERITGNIDGVHLESPQKDEGDYMVFKNGLTISFHYRNSSQGKYWNNGQVAEQIIKSVTFQKQLSFL